MDASSPPQGINVLRKGFASFMTLSYLLGSFPVMHKGLSPKEEAISPAMKAEFEDWGTTAGVLAGMLYCGACEAASSAIKEQSRLPFPQEDKVQHRKAVREVMEHKVLRIARGTVLGGAKLGRLLLSSMVYNMDLLYIGMLMISTTYLLPEASWEVLSV